MSVEPKNCSSIWINAAVLAVFLLGLTLRLIQTGESLWLDELHTAWTVGAGFGELAHRAALGNTSPLYFVLPWSATRLIGESELALRLPSIISGALLVGLTFIAVQRWTGNPAAGLFAALLVAIDRSCLFYSGEARVYSLLQLAGLAHVMIFAKVLESPDRTSRIGFVVMGALLFYLHYTSILLIEAEFVCYVVLSCRASWQPVWRPRKFMFDLLCLAALCAPASGHLAEIVVRRGNWELFIDKQPALAMLTLFPLDIYLIPPIIALLIDMLISVDWRRSDPKWAGRAFVLVGCWLVVPVAIAWMMTATNASRLFFPRYVAIGFISPIVFAALLFHSCSRRWIRIALFITVPIASLWYSGIAAQFRQDGRLIPDRNQDWRSAVASINSESEFDDLPIFVRGGLIEAETADISDDELREYCLFPISGLYQPTKAHDRMLRPLGTAFPKLTEEELGEISRCRGAWLVVCSDHRTASFVENRFRSMLPARFHARSRSRDRFGAIVVTRFACGSASVD